MPENLPVADSIKKLESKEKKATKKLKAPKTKKKKGDE
jgi:hypothetical protein